MRFAPHETQHISDEISNLTRRKQESHTRPTIRMLFPGKHDCAIENGHMYKIVNYAEQGDTTDPRPFKGLEIEKSTYDSEWDRPPKVLEDI